MLKCDKIEVVARTDPLTADREDDILREDRGKEEIHVENKVLDVGG